MAKKIYMSSACRSEEECRQSEGCEDEILINFTADTIKALFWLPVLFMRILLRLDGLWDMEV